MMTMEHQMKSLSLLAANPSLQKSDRFEVKIYLITSPREAGKGTESMSTFYANRTLKF